MKNVLAFSGLLEDADWLTRGPSLAEEIDIVSIGETGNRVRDCSRLLQWGRAEGCVLLTENGYRAFEVCMVICKSAEIGELVRLPLEEE